LISTRARRVFFLPRDNIFHSGGRRACPSSRHFHFAGIVEIFYRGDGMRTLGRKEKTRKTRRTRGTEKAPPLFPRPVSPPVRLVLPLLLVLPMLLAACGGPMPPVDPFHLGEAKDALGRGNHWFQRGCFAEADRYFELGLEQARLADDVPLIVKALNARGAALLAGGRLNPAALSLEQALELSDADPARPELDSVLGNLGLLALKAGRPDDAKELWGQAARAAAASGLNPVLYHCNLARLARSSGDDRAFREQTALAVAGLASEPAPAESSAADAYSLAALVALADGDDLGAETYLDLALGLDRKNENQKGLAQDLDALAGLQAKSGRPAEAAASLDRAFYLWAALGERANLAATLARLEALSKETGRPKSVAEYQKIYRSPSSFDPINRQCPY
jgi:tetratricopeptide (TPR) repeat protein